MMCSRSMEVSNLRPCLGQLPIAHLSVSCSEGFNPLIKNGIGLFSK